jgi:SOS-response transcriptional repressor LexA
MRAGEAVNMIRETPALSPTMASRKLQALAFIEFYFATHRTGPSIGEISAMLDCSRQRAHDLVRTLEREGRIKRTANTRRSIRPISAEEDALRQLKAAGYVLTNPGLRGRFDLDHIPAPHGQEIEARRKGQSNGGAIRPEH